jgi:hypothetical protein
MKVNLVFLKKNWRLRGKIVVFDEKLKKAGFLKTAFS